MPHCFCPAYAFRFTKRNLAVFLGALKEPFETRPGSLLRFDFPGRDQGQPKKFTAQFCWHFGFVLLQIASELGLHSGGTETLPPTISAFPLVIPHTGTISLGHWLGERAWGPGCSYQTRTHAPAARIRERTSSVHPLLAAAILLITLPTYCRQLTFLF